jgi:glutamate/tyrosine decarboxylase-like PLP-dependent enzyme
MGMPLSTSSFLTREVGQLNSAFNVNADYLFHQHEYDYDLGQKSLQGGRRPESLKLWLSLKFEGEIGFSKRIETLRKLAMNFATMIKNNPKFELFQNPDATIVCFRYFQENLSESEIDSLNIKIRESIFTEGKIIFNFAPLNQKIYLRCVILDPDFTNVQLLNILESIEKSGEELKSIR